MERIEEGLFWRDMIKSLPITVLVNPRRDYYNVRDCTLMHIWADDLPQKGYPELFRQISGMLCADDRKAFVREMEAAVRAGNSQNQTRVFAMTDQLGLLHAQLVFAVGGGDHAFELRMTKIGTCETSGDTPDSAVRIVESRPKVRKRGRPRKTKADEPENIAR